MTKIAVIVPFYQTRIGLLRASIESIISQEFVEKIDISVYIVDDGSPISPTEELTGLNLPAHISVLTLTQSNMGQCAARNAALEVVSEDTDFIAFLDSDDVWFPSHLADALAAMGDHGEFYFCDNYEDDDETTFQRSMYFGHRSRHSDWENVNVGIKAFRFKFGKAFETFIGEYVSQTSTIVCKRSQFETLRFREDLRASGEDYFVWLTIVRNSKDVIFSQKVNGRRGRGVSIYRDAYSWNSPKALNRLLGDLHFWKTVRTGFVLTKREQSIVSQHIYLKRMGISYLLVRNVLRHPAQNVKAVLKFLRMDLVGFALSPVLVFRAIVNARNGKLDFRLKLT